MKHTATALLASALFFVPGTAHADYHACSDTKADLVDTAVSAGSFNTLAAALQAADLVDTLKSDGPFTVFAPTDEAFAKLPAGTVENLLRPENKDTLVSILTYHVVPGSLSAKDVTHLDSATTVNGQRVDIKTEGSSVMIDGARVTAVDIAASNGTIHVIDRVILPETRNIVEIGAEAGTFKTLGAALEATGLLSALEGEGPFTVFAPTDEAFAKLPAGTVENLLLPENLPTLRNILLYHVVSGRVYADQVVKLHEADTLLGSPLAVRASRGSVRIGNANVIGTDIEGSNGVIHVIDSVLLPE